MSHKMIANNKKAFHDYFIDDCMEAGLVLCGTEVKSLRSGNASLKEAFCRIVNGEAFIYNMTIPIYEMGNRENHEPTQPRKLLLHRTEIAKLEKQVEIKGLTVVPLKLYFSKGRAKLEIGVGRGKKLFDKRQSLKDKQATREVERTFSSRRHD